MTDQKNTDQDQTQEWLDALNSLIEFEGHASAQFTLEKVLQKATAEGISLPSTLNTPYINTIPVSEEPTYPGDLELEKKITALIRWNAIAMVLQGNKQAPDVGGHLSTYASSAILYEVGFNHFFHAASGEHGGDLLYIQGHSSPGIYSRAFLEGRFTEKQIANFRQETLGIGISSYPHSWLMPDFWQFATVSMGLGPIQAIYQARFLKYLHNRGLLDTSAQKVWMFCGDGEMDEPESTGALMVASREKLDNLIFVVNCNLQRLDGPVRGNGKIIQELESVFRGAGWNVIKVIWDSQWDALLAKDTAGLLKTRMEEVLDGDYQNYAAKHDGAFIRQHFFGKHPELLGFVSHLSDSELYHLGRGGHDPKKVYAAYAAAVKHTGQPTVILAKTVKGYGLGVSAGESTNITHQQKKMTMEDLKKFCHRFSVPLTDEQIEKVAFCHPGVNTPEIKYILEHRQKLGGHLPKRRLKETTPLKIPVAEFTPFFESSNGRHISTTMVFARIVAHLVKNPDIGKHLVPIIPDEARTFGMEGLFRQIGIYAPTGQLYTPVDSTQVAYYREDKKGQLLEEGITEAGAFCSWIAAGTSYSNCNYPMIPFYIYYSMFGFQRTGDLAYAAGDMRTRGFLLGGTAGRTTLAGEGLQHQDGHNHLVSATVPNCVSYDPTFGYELAVILREGLIRMYERRESVYYYITLMNENYEHPAMPANVEEGIIKGMYLFKPAPSSSKLSLQMLGSGTILRDVLEASELLAKDFDIHADVWSVPSFTELRREGMAIERENMLHPTSVQKIPYVTQSLKNRAGPVVAATDYMRSFADQIRNFIPHRYVVLGTDGYGRSDSREHLRQFFEVNPAFIAVAALKALSDDGKIPATVVLDAIKKYKIDPNKPDPVTV